MQECRINLGGNGPDTWAPNEGIRYVNVGSLTASDGSQTYLDLLVTAVDTYQPYDPSRNGLAGSVARINFLIDSCATLRVAVYPSCATAESCAMCADSSLYPSSSARATCYAAGCSCYGQTVYVESDCSGDIVETRRQSYACDQMDTSTTFPVGSLISFVVFNLDGGSDGEYIESVSLSGYDYYVTPLRPASDR